MALPADSAATSGRLSTVVLLWREAAEFAVDVVDAGITAADDRSPGHLEVLVRRVPVGTGASSGPETLRLRCGKEMYWRAAMNDGDRVLKRMHAVWLAQRVETVIDDNLVDTRDEGKSMAFADLKRKLADRAKRHAEWRNLGSKKARRDAWQRYVEESAADEEKYLNTVHDIMLNDIAHRWLDIEILNSNNDRAGGSSDSSFKAMLKSPNFATRGSDATKKRDGAEETNVTSSHQHTSFAALGLDGFTDRSAHFSRKNTSLKEDLTSVITPARTEAGECSECATSLIDKACLTEEELEAKRQAEYARLDALRRLQGMDDEERFIDFLCSINQSKQEMKLTDAGVGWRELPGLDDQKLLDILNMRNMLARRRFLQAIVARLGEEKVRRVRAGDGFDTDEDEEDVAGKKEDADENDGDHNDGDGNHNSDEKQESKLGGEGEENDSDSAEDEEDEVGSEIYDYDSDLYRR